jgi:hypothetical protein
MYSACQPANKSYTSGAHCRTCAAESDIYTMIRPGGSLEGTQDTHASQATEAFFLNLTGATVRRMEPREGIVDSRYCVEERRRERSSALTKDPIAEVQLRFALVRSRDIASSLNISFEPLVLVRLARW